MTLVLFVFCVSRTYFRLVFSVSRFFKIFSVFSYSIFGWVFSYCFPYSVSFQLNFGFSTGLSSEQFCNYKCWRVAFGILLVSDKGFWCKWSDLLELEIVSFKGTPRALSFKRWMHFKRLMFYFKNHYCIYKKGFCLEIEIIHFLFLTKTIVTICRCKMFIKHTSTTKPTFTKLWVGTYVNAILKSL